jgi:hypothetical protein
LTYQPGPDEDFYSASGRRRRGRSAARSSRSWIRLWLHPRLTFKLAGPNLSSSFPADPAGHRHGVCIFLIGRELGRPRGGLYGALLYGLTCTAVLFSTTLLKATWVANFMVLWVLFGLILLRTRKLPPWFLFGIWCGYGIALRGTLLLMTGFAVVLLPWLSIVWSKRSVPDTARRVGLLVVGLALPVALLTVRNDHLSKTFSPLPNNGGVVLHQVYNADNPTGVNWVRSS